MCIRYLEMQGASAQVLHVACGPQPLYGTDNLERRGWTKQQGACVFCSHTQETCSHLFVHRNFTTEVWLSFMALVGAAFLIAAGENKVTGDWWLRARKAVPKLLRRDYDVVVILVHWRIWKERNA